MEKIIIAFDVDGTLRKNDGDPNSMNPNNRIVTLLRILSTFKNVRIIVWSGGGEEWARECVETFNLEKYVRKTLSKNHKGLDEKGKHTFEPSIIPDIAIDDIQACDLGKINLIVKEK